MDNLERYEIKQELVSRGLEEIPADSSEFAARGLLPLGKLGAASFFSLQNEAEVFRQKVAQELDKDTVTPLPIHLHIGDFFLSGIVESIYENRLVQFRCAKIKPKDRLRAWIHHLAKCAVEKETGPETLLIGEDETIVFSPVKNAHTLLEKLLGIYWRGLVEPAAFFAAASFAYAKAKTNPSSRETVSPMQKAENEWRGNLMKKGERDDPYCAFYFADKEPLDEKFAALALEVFEPMLRHSAE